MWEWSVGNWINSQVIDYGRTCELDDEADHTATKKQTDATIAQSLYRVRRYRERLFCSRLFSEPSWDLLLDLFFAEKIGKRVSITSACVATAAPITTALRCVRRLEREGVVYRERDHNDGRRTYVRLTRESLERMERLLAEFRRHLELQSRHSSY